jgi:hypothetical protein
MTQTQALSRRRMLEGAAGTALLGIIGFPAITKAQAETIKIGHLTPLTGFLGQLGVYGQNAAKMAVEEINGHGGVLGRKLELVTEDSVNPGVAVTKTQKLVEQDKVLVIIGEISSASAGAIMEQAKRLKALYFNTGANSDELRGANCNRYTFHIEGCNTMYTKTIGEWQKRQGLIKGAKWYMLTADYAFGHDLAVPRVHESEQGHRRIPQPAEAIILIARAADLLRQRRCRRRHDAASRRIGQRLQGDQRTRETIRIRSAGSLSSAALAVLIRSRRDKIIFSWLLVGGKPLVAAVKGRADVEFAESFVQQGIELGPHLIFLRAGDMTIRAFVLGFHLGSWCLWLMMIEIVEPPPSGIGIALGVLDGHIGAIEGPGEIAPPRRLGSRTIGVLARQRELQLLEHDCPFGKCIRLLVYLVGAWLDVDVVILREPGVAVIKRVGSEWRSDVHPFVEILRQNQIAGGGVLGQITRPRLRLRAAAGEPLCEYGCHNHGSSNQHSYHCESYAHCCSP